LRRIRFQNQECVAQKTVVDGRVAGIQKAIACPAGFYGPIEGPDHLGRSHKASSGDPKPEEVQPFCHSSTSRREPRASSFEPSFLCENRSFSCKRESHLGTCHGPS